MIRSLSLALVVSGLLSMTACSRPDPVTNRPIALLLIVIDTLRADRVGFAGYEFAVTPTLDSLAMAGVRFDDASTPVPVTLPAMASLLTGLYPPRHGVRDNGTFALDALHTTLAERFRSGGFRTAAVLGSAVLAADRGLARGFERYDADFVGPYPVHDPSLRPYAEEFATNRRRADSVTDRATSLLHDFAEDPFFLMVHYFDVHMNYDPPPKYAALHPRRPYDAEVSFVDAQVDRLLHALGDRNDVLVVVVADHGESQGEHGEPQHGFLLYQATLHVPLVVAGPGVPVGIVREDPVSLVDLEPTLGAVFGLDALGAERDGRVLNWSQPETDDRPFYAETFRPLLSYGWSELRSMRRADRKLIRGGDTDELYDLAVDPTESEDRSDAGDFTELAGMLDNWTEDDDPEAVLRATQDVENAQSSELLESLGYLSGDADGAAGARPHPRAELPIWVARQEAKQQLRQAALLLSVGRFDAADSLAALVMNEVPDPANVLAFRGYVKEHRGDLDGAAAYYRDALTRSPGQSQARRGMARISETKGHYDEALRHWRVIADADSTDVGALRFVALALLGEPDSGAALPYLRSLVNLDPNDATSHYNLAIAAVAANRKVEARRHFEETLRLDPDDSEAESIRAWLENEATSGAPR